MTAAARGRLLERPGIKAVIEKVVRETQTSNPNAMRNFTGLLAAFDPKLLRLLSTEADAKPESRETALALSQGLKRRRNIEEPGAVLMAGYAPDVIDISRDPLDVQEDVRTRAAVMLAKDPPPPLAIGLFGDWGSGKSYFIKSMISTAKKMAEKNPNSKFCAHIASVEFNAWHYADTILGQPGDRTNQKAGRERVTDNWETTHKTIWRKSSRYHSVSAECPRTVMQNSQHRFSIQ